MKMQSNTIFITGGGTGIGKGLAEAFHKFGNQVIISGRRESVLQSICAANPGMQYFVLDVADRSSIHNVARKVIEKYPALNCVFNNAGVQTFCGSLSDDSFDDAGMLEEVNINLLGLIRMSAEVLPHLKKQVNATLVNVSSGLAFVPISFLPIYCATKAAVHSYSLSLRHQLKNSKVKVIELIPPYVSTELGGPSKAPPPGVPQPMPLETFVSETMKELAGDADEIAIGLAKNLLAATSPESVMKIFAGMNH